jgi:hypothetical protein
MKINANLRLATPPHRDNHQAAVSMTSLSSIHCNVGEKLKDRSIVRGASIANLAHVAACLVEIVVQARHGRAPLEGCVVPDPTTFPALSPLNQKKKNYIYSTQLPS